MGSSRSGSLSLLSYIRENVKKLRGFSFLAVGVYNESGRPLYEEERASAPNSPLRSFPYLLAAGLEAVKFGSRSGREPQAIVLSYPEFNVVLVSKKTPVGRVSVLYAVEKGWFLFSSAERAVKRATSFLNGLDRALRERNG